LPAPEKASGAGIEWLTLPAGQESFDTFRSFVLAQADSSSIPQAKMPALELALEEMLVNVISYAYEGGSGLIHVGCGTDQNRFIVLIKDEGKPFNPLEASQPKLDAAMDDRPVGGLGIHLVKTMVDGVSYSREGDSNVLALAFQL